MKLLFPLIALTLLAPFTFAQSPLNVVGGSTNVASSEKKAAITDLSWMDQSRMEREINSVNELAQSKTGNKIRRDLSDLDTLQRIVNNNLIEMDDYESQQALGVVMGNVMIADFPSTFEWKIYEDELGRSRALCVKKTSDCLFPVTMLSRRMEIGTKPDVKKIYNDAIMLMEKHLPKLPYDGGIMYKLPRR